MSNKDANTDEKVQCRKSISKFLEREAASSCSQNREEVFVYKTAEKKLKLVKAIFVGPDDESVKAGEWSFHMENHQAIFNL